MLYESLEIHNYDDKYHDAMTETGHPAFCFALVQRRIRKVIILFSGCFKLSFTTFRLYELFWRVRYSLLLIIDWQLIYFSTALLFNQW